ncbi:MAG: aspartate carbamoyltransferase regulatory subunit [Acutalibacteraceae bacterium]|nr:aspartate carbamoyltransferase regulatory subunit [Acutalibacteraceae bacterium]
MNIDSITNGFVIDHITAGRGMKLYDLLGLDNLDCSVAIIKNVASKKMGKKDIIKIDADIAIDIDVIGYVDPGTTVNVIKNCELVEKRTIELPQMLTNVIKCKNPRCITSTEQEINHVFKLTDKDNGVYRCIYCETQAK